MARSDLGNQPDYSFEESSELVLQAVDGGTLTVPGESWLLTADFTPQGSDLLLTSPDGAQVLIRDFFSLDVPPDLVTEAGGMIPADLAVKLAGPAAPGQFALLENGPFAELAQASESIGRVEATDGLVEAIRVDGTKVALSKGDDIFQGDTLVTAKGAAIGITFVDDTTFSLGEEGRMVIDEMVYDPATQEGAFSANLVQGVFSFVSGEIAKTGVEAMTVTTPVATIGIRGTKVAGRAAQEGSENTISLLPEVNPDGTQFVGQLAVAPLGGGGPPVVLASVGATVQMTSAFEPVPPPVVFSPQQIQQNFGSTLTTLSTTAAAKATADAEQNAQEAEQAQEQAQQAEAEAEQAAAEAEQAAAEAEAAQAEAEAAGDPEAIAAAEAAAAEAEAKAAEAEAKAAEAEAAAAEAEAAQAEAEQAQAEAEHANNEMQAQAEAFAQFGGPVPPGAEGDAPAEGEGPPDGDAPQEGEAPPDGEAPAEGDQLAEGEGPPEGEGDPLAEGEGPGPDDGAIEQAAADAAQAALDAGATQEEAAQAGFEAAREQAIAEGASPEEIAAAEEAFNAALAAGMSPEDAMQAAGDAAGQVNPDGPGGPGDDPNAPGAPGNTGPGDPNAPGGIGTGPGGFGPEPGGFTGGGLGGFDGGLGGFDGGLGGFDGGLGGFDGGLGGFDGGLGGFDGGLGFEGGYNFDSGIIELGGHDPHGDDGHVDYSGQGGGDDETTGSFPEHHVGTTGDDNFTGGDLNTQFIMEQGFGLGGTDTIDGQLGTDEIAFLSIDDFWGIYDSTGVNELMTYSTSDSSITGQITLFDIEQLYADDGVEIYTDSALSSRSSTNGVRLDIQGGGSGYGYLRGGTSGNDTLSLADTNSVATFGALSHEIDDTQIFGSIMFGKGGNDTMTGTVEGDIIFGGTGDDTIDGGGSSSKDGDILIGGAGNDTFNMSTSSLSNSAIVGGSDTDTVSYASYASHMTFNIGTSSISATHDSTVNDSLTGIETLNGVSNGAYVNSFNFSGDTTGTGLTSITAGGNNDTFNFGSGAKYSGSLNGGSGTDAIASSGANVSEGDMDLSGATITNISTVSLNNDNATTSGTTTLTVNNSTSFASGMTISAGSNSNSVSIESVEGLNLSGVTLSNIDNIYINSDQAGSTEYLLMDASTNLGTAPITISRTGGGTGYVQSNGGMNLSNATVTNVSFVAFGQSNTGTHTLILNDTSSVAVTLYGGTDADEIVSLSEAGTYALGGISQIATVTGSTGTDVLTLNISSTLDGKTLAINGNGGTGDTLNFDGITTGGTLDLNTSEIGGITDWDSWVLGSNANFTMALAEANIASAATMTIDASAVTSNTATIDASLETDGTLTYTGGGGTDALTVASAMVDGTTAVLDGNGGTDNLILNGTANLTATELAAITDWETWTLGSDAAYTITLHANNATTGSLTINATAVTSATATVDATNEISQTVHYTGGAGVNVLTVKVAMLDAAAIVPVLSGGGGSSDALTIFGTGTLDATELASISGFETWTLTGATDTMTLNNANVASGQTLTIDATGNTGAVSIDGSAETDGNFVYSASGNGDTFTGGSGADTITGGAGADSIAGGAGADTLTGSGGIDTFTYVTADVAAAGTASVAYDTLSGFTSGASGDIFDWDTVFSNAGNAIGSAGANIPSTGFLSAAIGDTVITGSTTTEDVYFEFTGASLGANDIVVGTTTSATIEGWAAAALSTVDHASGDNLIFAMYDSGGTSTVAFLEFTGDATTTGITASELQCVAVADITQDSLVGSNIT